MSENKVKCVLAILVRHTRKEIVFLICTKIKRSLFNTRTTIDICNVNDITIYYKGQWNEYLGRMTDNIIPDVPCNRTPQGTRGDGRPMI
jgi:hypothetical protein